MAGATDQLDRLLTLIPWLQAHPGVPKETAARAFGITVAQLEGDLGLAVCAEVGRDAQANLDIDYWDDTITVHEAQQVGHPLRLQLDEALSLIVGLRYLAGSRTVGSEVVASALAKLEDALSTSGRLLLTDATPPERPSRGGSRLAEVRVAVAEALEKGRRLELDYWVPARDEVTTRQVDPWTLVVLPVGSYVQGWCHQSDDVRTFRLDRITRAAVLDEPIDHVQDRPAHAVPGPGGPWSEEGDQVVVLELDPHSRWVVDYYPLESATELPGHRLRVVLRTADLAWARRLVLRLAGHAQVVEPASLAAEVASVAAATLEAYVADPPKV